MAEFGNGDISATNNAAVPAVGNDAADPAAGNDPSDPALPPGMAIYYGAPAPGLLPCITGYNAYRADSREPRTDWFLPAPAMLCVSVDAGPIDVQIGRRGFPLTRASVIGPFSQIMHTTTQGGSMIGIGISAAGWARMTTVNASTLHNRVVPASALLGDAAEARLIAALDGVTALDQVKPILDALLPGLMRRESADEPLIMALMKLAVTDGVIEAGDVAERLDIAPFVLRRLSQRYFGLTPKLLLRRARFLRSFMRLFEADGGSSTGGGTAAIDSSYHDMSHYLRDANTFLGTTPRRFMRVATPFLVASVKARKAVLGASTQALHDDVGRMAAERGSGSGGAGGSAPAFLPSAAE